MAREDRRNPYVILGVPFAASGEQARVRFARASRRLRQHPDSVYSQEDLTWALHQVEQIITKPELAFEVYRLPASPSVLSSVEPGVFHPVPHPIQRITQPDPEEWESARRQALAAALRRVMVDKVPESTEYVPYE